MKRILAIILTALMLVNSIPAFAKTVNTLVSKQTEFRAFFYDAFDQNSFLFNDSETYKDVIKYAKNNSFRAIFIKTTTSANSIYPSRYLDNLAQGDLLKEIIAYAKENEVRVYAVIDVQTVLGGTVASRLSGWTSDGQWNLSVPQVSEFILSYTKELAKYNVDGIVADNFWYSSEDFDDSFAIELYAKKDKETHRRNTTSSLVKSMYDIVKKTNPNTYFGVGTPSVCVNKENVLSLLLKSGIKSEASAFTTPTSVTLGKFKPLEII